MRDHNYFDQLIMIVDNGIRSLFTLSETSRQNPADQYPEYPLTPEETNHSAALMRINHSGELCAQALYRGQALTAKNPAVREQMQQAAFEENDHLIWCHQRLEELGSHTSFLGPFWYFSSFFIGACTGLIGDKWSLGFVAETERQVVIHLQNHLDQIAESDNKTKAILIQMQIDEKKHQTLAYSSGGTKFSSTFQWIMRQSSKIMTKTAYWI